MINKKNFYLVLTLTVLVVRVHMDVTLVLIRNELRQEWDIVWTTRVFR